MMKDGEANGEKASTQELTARLNKKYKKRNNLSIDQQKINLQLFPSFITLFCSQKWQTSSGFSFKM